MRRSLPKELSKKNLIKDNAAMLDRLHAYKDLTESQLIANIKLEMSLKTVQLKYDALVNKLNAECEEELHV